ncbi:MAG: hypothetical protein HC817_10510 [Saprospiraceae bacterium]|nr:hypothetical protein [Saprospiraceae bacterium]
MMVDEMNPKNIYAAFWDKTRTAWNFLGNGKKFRYLQKCRWRRNLETHYN